MLVNFRSLALIYFMETRTNFENIILLNSRLHKLKGKAVPLQAWSGPESSRKLRFPYFMITAQDDGKVVSLTHRPPLAWEMLLVVISVRGWVDPRAIVRSEGFYVNEKFQRHKLGSNQRPSDLWHSTLTTVPPRSTLHTLKTQYWLLIHMFQRLFHSYKSAYYPRVVLTSYVC